MKERIKMVNWKGGYKKWYKNGQLQLQATFKNGVLVGQFKEYYPSGNLSRMGQYNKDGKLKGSITHWHENGEKAEEDKYNVGGKLLSHKQWDEQGNLIEEQQ